jgi:hypothetical protein
MILKNFVKKINKKIIFLEINDTFFEFMNNE